jgi:hypothetical protein
MLIDNTTGITAGSYFATQFNHAVGVAANVFNVFAVQVDRPSIDGSGFTVTNAASLYVADAPGGTAAKTNSYALFVDSGKTRLDGDVGIGVTDTGSKLQVNGNVAIAFGDVATGVPTNGLGVQGALSTTPLPGCRAGSARLPAAHPARKIAARCYFLCIADVVCYLRRLEPSFVTSCVLK